MKKTKKSAYQKAYDAPTSKDGKGWKYADEKSMQASYAQGLGINFCLNPQAVFDWAERHKISLSEHRKQLFDTPDLLLVAVLNDLSIEDTISKLPGDKIE